MTTSKYTRTNLAGPSVQQNNKVEAEKKARLEAKRSTASKDDKIEAQKSHSMAKSLSLKTKAVDEMFTGQKSLDLYQENFPVLIKREDNKTKDFILPGSLPLVKNSPTHRKFEDFTKGFGAKMLEKYGWVKGTAIGNKTGAIIAPLFQSRESFDGKPVTVFKPITKTYEEKRLQVVNDLESLLVDDYEENNDMEKAPFLPASLEWFHLGSFDAPLVRDVRGLSIGEEPQQDPQATDQRLQEPKSPMKNSCGKQVP